MRSAVLRTFTFEPSDIAIRSDGTGRTVEAYAAVFDTPTEIHDSWGHYNEQLSRTAFNHTIERNGGSFPVFYNHGLTIHGTPSEMGSFSIGRTESVTPDYKGLLTVSRYNNTTQADNVLETIRNGDVRGMSWSGKIISQDVKTPRGGFKAAADGSLTLVTRTEIALKELGPTPFPYYPTANIVGVRSVDLLRAVREMDDEELAEYAALLNLPVARLEDAARDASPSTEAAESDDQAAYAEPSGRTFRHNRLRLLARQSGVLNGQDPNPARGVRDLAG